MLTPSQLEEMRRCVVGPCSEQEKQEIREGLERIGEKVEDEMWWTRPTCDNAFYYDVREEWISCAGDPTITAADFITKYLQP